MSRRFSFKGYYKGWLFRSLKELNFVLTCELNGQNWASAEVAELSVFYTDIHGKTRKHYADFLIDNHIIVEVKPTCYQKSKTVKNKAEAMKAFCLSRGYTYMMVSPRKPNRALLKQMYLNKEITIIDGLDSKFKKYLGL